MGDVQSVAQRNLGSSPGSHMTYDKNNQKKLNVCGCFNTVQHRARGRGDEAMKNMTYEKQIEASNKKFWHNLGLLHEVK